MKGEFSIHLAALIIVTALEALVINWVWNTVVTLRFGAEPMLYGHMFLLLFAVRVFFRDLMKLDSINEVLLEIRDIQHYEAQRAGRTEPKTEDQTSEDNFNK